MAFAIDAVLIFTAVFCIWAGAKKGFVRSVMGVVTTVVSAVAAYAFTPPAAAFIRERFLGERITGGIAEALRSMSLDPATELFDLDRVVTDLDNNSFADILERYHIDLSDIIGRMRGVTAATEDTVQKVAEDIASGTVNVLSSVIAFLVLFILIFIVLSILTAVLDLVFSMPVLKGANVALGIVFGVVEAVVFVWILSIALSELVRALGAVDPKIFGDEAVDRTVVCGFCLRYNPLELLRGILK